MLLASKIVSSGVSSFSELVPHLTCMEVILERAIQEQAAVDSISEAIKSQRFSLVHHVSKRDVMKDIVGTYSKVFGTKGKKKKKKKKEPVVFLPKPKGGKDCDPSSRMSSFGYLAFVLSLINAAVNAANNVNNNQNNNNNNNNDINDNNNNINIANSNLNQNNDNAVTAGRRRRKFEAREKMRKMLAAHVLHSKSVASMAKKKRMKREEQRDFHKESVQQCLLASFMFMDAWQHLEAGRDLGMADLCHIQDALVKIGPWATVIGRPLALGMAKEAAQGHSKVAAAEHWRLLAKSQLQCP